MATCALVAASDFNAEHFRAAYEAGRFDAVIAADGGFAHLQRLDIAPSIALGDFDSLGYVPAECPVRAYPSHKDESDAEIAFEYAAEQGFDEVMAYGMLGGRLDHTLANIQLMAAYAERGMAVSAVHLDCQLRYVVGPSRYELPPLPEGTVSVFSLVPAATGVTERGLEYPLDDAVMTDRTTRGLSNELVGAPASVAVETGTLLVFHPPAFPS